MGFCDMKLYLLVLKTSVFNMELSQDSGGCLCGDCLRCPSVTINAHERCEESQIPEKNLYHEDLTLCGRGSVSLRPAWSKPAKENTN